MEIEMMDLNKTALGIELGSTRIKAVLIDDKHIPVASGDFEWENQLVNGVWTYSMDVVHIGIRTCFANLKADVKEKFGLEEGEKLKQKMHEERIKYLYLIQSFCLRFL